MFFFWCLKYKVKINIEISEMFISSALKTVEEMFKDDLSDIQ